MLDDALNRVFWTVLFDYCGLPRNPKVPCQHPTKPEYTLGFGWPDLQIGVAYETDPKAIQAFRRAGWTIYEFTPQALDRAAPFLALIRDLAFEKTVRVSAIDATHKVSKDENKLLDAILRAGLPEPDRNFTFLSPSGQKTTPDFTWEDIRLAVFVDGLFHHGGRDRDKVIKAAAEDPAKARRLEEAERTRVTRDAAARRAMTSDGWRVITVTDAELGNEDTLAEVAYEIVAVYKNAS